MLLLLNPQNADPTKDSLQSNLQATLGFMLFLLLMAWLAGHGYRPNLPLNADFVIMPLTGC
jgi:hypothetical protein